MRETLREKRKKKRRQNVNLRRNKEKSSVNFISDKSNPKSFSSSGTEDESYNYQPITDDVIFTYS